MGRLGQEIPLSPQVVHLLLDVEQELVEERGRAKRARRRHARGLKEMSKLRSDLTAAEMRAATATTASATATGSSLKATVGGGAVASVAVISA